MSRRKEPILVVDDAPETLEVLQRNLASKGYQVYTALGVQEALRVLDTASISLVITDYKMPRGSGLDLVRHVRENFADAEVIMITGWQSQDYIQESTRLGAFDYIVKPFEKAKVQKIIQEALKK